MIFFGFIIQNGQQPGTKLQNLKAEICSGSEAPCSKTVLNTPRPDVN